MGLAVHTMLPAGTGYTTLEFKISFIRGMTKDSGTVRSEGRTLNVGRRTATAEARITDARGAGCWRTPPPPAWCSIYRRKTREREPLTAVDSGQPLRRSNTMSVVSADLEPLTIVFADDGLVPNNPMPLLVYRRAIEVGNDHPEKNHRGAVRRQWLGPDVAQRGLCLPALPRDGA